MRSDMEQELYDNFQPIQCYDQQTAIVLRLMLYLEDGDASALTLPHRLADPHITVMTLLVHLSATLRHQLCVLQWQVVSVRAAANHHSYHHLHVRRGSLGFQLKNTFLKNIVILRYSNKKATFIHTHPQSYSL